MNLQDTFADRHLGPRTDDVARMLEVVGFDSLDDLMDAAVPGSIASRTLDLPEPLSEYDAARELRRIAAANRPAESMIGLGYHATITPPVVRRNVLEDPSWYTAYTPYQPEISQGRLEALLNFQTVIGDLTGLPTANASLLDEGTAAAEAMTLVRRAQRGATGPFVVDADALPQTIEVIRTRAAAMGIDVVVADLADGLPDGDLCGVLVQYPGASGRILDPRPVIEDTHERGALAVVAADLLALTLLESPGQLGADVVVGSSQRFGVPMFYGGPHAGYMSVSAGLERHLPGRLVGVSVDAEGRPAYRLALQTREQHIRRDKATSNICTAQVLLAVVASMYAVYHGPEGLRGIAERINDHARGLAAMLRKGGVEIVHERFFDTLLARVPGRASEIVAAARERDVQVRLVDDDHVGLSVGETFDGHTFRAVLRGVRGLHAREPLRLERGHDPRRPGAHHAVPDPRGLRHPPQRDPDAALPAAAVGPRLRPRPRDDPARLLHDEAERHDRDGAGVDARLRRPASVRAGGGRPGLPRADRAARVVAGRGDRLRPRLDPAERRLAGRAGRAPGDPRLPPRPRRRGPHGLPDPVLGPRHQRRLRGDGRHAGRRRQGRGQRLGRPRRPARAVREARRLARRPDGDLPLHPRRLRGHHHRAVPDRARGRWPGVRRRRQPQRPARTRPPR